MYDFERIKNDLKNLVNDERYNHSLAVADECKLLAVKWDYDVDKAYIAGLVHDIAKDIDIDESKRLIDKYNLRIDMLEEKYRKILHAEVGYGLVKEMYNFDNEICNAVRYHTIGNVNMSKLDKIVFIADKIARNDLSSELLLVKEMAYKDLDKSLLLFLEDEKEYLNKKGVKLHNDTIELINVLKEGIDL